MDKLNYKWALNIIGITVVITIAVQVYWNFREYQINKEHLVDKVQLSLDNSVETYFANLTKSGIITFNSPDASNPKDKTDTIIVSTNSRFGFRKKIDSTLQNLVKKDSLGKPLIIKNSRNESYPFFTPDRNFPKNLDSLISKVVVSISRDTLDLKKLNSYLIDEFERNNIDVRYGLKFNYAYRNSRDSIVHKSKDLDLDDFPKNHLTATSNSTFLHRSKLMVYFTNETVQLLKSSLFSILLSFLLSISIIASIIYLLKTIYKQKQLAEVKNDLISNITHEFKTPIATISTALEALKSFNALNDKEKSEKYISIANSQVGKLNEMVEKILETAVLNQDELKIQKQKVNLPELMQGVIDKFKFINSNKEIEFIHSGEQIFLSLDQFHFENAIGNIIDNAIKYGGNKISVELKSVNSMVSILISDNGKGIPKGHKEQVFEQFYRIPTGNTHNVKGFGIGLFYTESIIEKHNGKIQIVYNENNNTTFKIDLLNE